MAGHCRGECSGIIFAKSGSDTGSLAPWAMAAAVLVSLRDIAGAAAGIAEFFGRRAFFTVAW